MQDVLTLSSLQTLNSISNLQGRLS